jgi:hypothetical protein
VAYPIDNSPYPVGWMQRFEGDSMTVLCARIIELEAELDEVRTNYHNDQVKWQARDQEQCEHINYRETLTGAECIDCGLEEPMVLSCSICQENIEHKKQGSMIWADGNNAQPVNAGRCCDKCDCYIVIPTRLGINPESQHGKDMGGVMYELRINPPTFPPQGDEQ